MSSLEYYRPPHSNVSWFVDQYGRFPSSMQEAWERRVLVDAEGYNEYVEGPYATPMDLAFQAEGPTLTGNFPDSRYDSPFERALENFVQLGARVVGDTLGGPVDVLTYLLNGPPQLINGLFGTDIPLIEHPVGGSDHIYDWITELVGMGDAGWTRDPNTEMTPFERPLFTFGPVIVGPYTPWPLPPTENPFGDLFAH